METGALTDAELTHFGIRFEDEGLHPFDPTEEWWNESWFWDWFDDAGELAGHCRIGLHPVQKRAWAWLFLYHQGEWVAVEETRLPLGDVQLPRSTSRTRSSPASLDLPPCPHPRISGRRQPTPARLDRAELFPCGLTSEDSWTG